MYCIPLFMVGITITSTYHRKNIIGYFHSINNVLRNLEKMGIHQSLKFPEIYLIYIVLSISFITLIVIDIIRSGDKYSVFFWISSYLPGFAVAVYIITILYFFLCCNQIFIVINKFLESLCCTEMTNLEKLALNKKNIKPDKLLDPVPEEDYTHYEKIFILHDETCEIVRYINTVSGYEFLIFIGFTTVALLSLTYDSCLDLVMYSRGVPSMHKSFYATSYWPIIYLFIFLNIIWMSSNLMNNCNSTKFYLHKLRNIYPQLQEHVSI